MKIPTYIYQNNTYICSWNIDTYMYLYFRNIFFWSLFCTKRTQYCFVVKIISPFSTVIYLLYFSFTCIFYKPYLLFVKCISLLAVPWFPPSPLLFASLAVFMVQFRVGQPWLGKNTQKKHKMVHLGEEMQIITKPVLQILAL